MLVLALVRVFGTFYAPLWGFWMNRRPHRGTLAAFLKKKNKKKKKKKKNARGKVGWARLELPEPLLTKQKVKMAGYWPSSSVRFY